MKKNKLTREQRLSFARDRHLSVTANAGSGKTTVLIDKYIDILLNDEKVDKDPTRILAITFTRVAASEMYMRAAKAIDKFIEVEKEHKKLKTLFEVRDRLTYAKITTIHSFCSNILRDFPIEAGIPPNFAELSEFDKDKLQQEAMEAVIESKLISLENDNAFRNFFDLYGIANIKNILNSIISKPDIYEAVKLNYNCTDFELSKSFDKVVRDYVLEHIHTFLDFAQETNEFPEKREHVDKFFEQTKKIERLYKLANSKEELDSDTITSFFLLIKERIGRSSFGGLLGKLTNKAKEVDDIKKKLKAILDIFDIDGNKELIDATRLLIDLADAYFVEYGRLKGEYSAIDFDDMIFKVRDMLADDEIARRVREDFDYILVDEFQDTNQAQFDIIKALVPGLDNPDFEDDLRCYIVGDGKQSIYAFRGADVRVFKNAIENIKEHNNHKISKGKIKEYFKLPESAGFNPPLDKVLPENESEKLGALNLSCSFRLLPVPAAFVNYFFNKIEPTKSNEYHIKYEDLVCGRDIARLFEQRIESNECIEMDSSFGSVSILLNLVNKETIEESEDSQYELDENDLDEDDGLFEADMLAAHIANITSSDSDYSLFDNDRYKRPEFKDIAVLSRNRNKLNTLVSALLKYNIPYQIHSGKGFFATPEITDIIQFLSFLSNENNDFALATILKSPFFGFTNEELFEISVSGERNNSFFRKLIAYSEATEQECETYCKLSRTLKIIKLIKFYSTRIPISSLLTKIIDTGGYWGVIAKSPAGKQIESNFDKLIQFARNFEKKGFKTLNDFVVELEHLSEKSNEAEAVSIIDSNAVQIVTVHGAKGAEFPIVYLYAASFVGNKDREPFLDDQLGLFFKIRRDTDNIIQAIDIPINLIAKQNIREAQLAEERRILYVAMTRARDHLIITGELKSSKNGYRKPSMYLDWIFSAFNIDTKNNSSNEDGIDALTVESNIDVCLNKSYRLKVLYNNVFRNISTKFNLRVTTKSIVGEAYETPDVVKSEKAIMLEPIKGNFAGSIYSASRLNEFQKDSEKFLLKYLTGLDIDSSKFDELPDSETTYPSSYGMIPGTIIHEVLERVNTWIIQNEINTTILSELILSRMNMRGLSEAEELHTRIYSDCKSTLESKFMHNNLNALLCASHEIELNVPIGVDFLTGAIDCLIETSAGFYEVWDWKSNRINSPEDLNYLSQNYKLQMDTYAYLLMLLHQNQEKYVCRLIFTNGAEKARSDEEWIKTFTYHISDKNELEAKLIEMIEVTKLIQ